MSLARRCASCFENRTRSRGREYEAAQAVEIREFDDDGADADVAGSNAEPYEVGIDWSDEEDGVLRAGCTCPHFSDGYLCKHIWATLLAIDKACDDDSFAGPALTVGRLEIDSASYLMEDDAFDVESRSDFADEDYDERPSGLLDGVLRLLPISSRGETGRDAASLERQPDWTRPFRELHRHTFTEQAEEPWDEIGRRFSRAWYVLDVTPSVNNAELTIDLFYQEQKKNGDYGKIKRLKFDESMVDSFEDPADRELLPQLLACSRDDDNRYGYYHAFGSRAGTSVTSLQLPKALQQFFLPRIAATGRFLWMLDTSQPIEQGNQIRWDNSASWEFRVKITAHDDTQEWKLDGELFRGTDRMATSELIGVIGGDLLLTKSQLSHLRTDTPATWIEWVVRHAPVAIPYQHRDTFVKLLWAAPSLPGATWPENLALEQIVDPPQPCLRVQQETSPHHREVLTADVSFLYGHARVAPDERDSGFPEPADENGPIRRVRVRDLANERMRIRELNAIPTVSHDHKRVVHGTLRFKKRALSELVDRLLATGWQVEAAGKQFRMPGEFRIDVESGIDWFDLNASIDFGGISAQLPDLLGAVRRGEKFVELGDGSQGVLPDDWLRQYTGLAALGETAGDKVRFKRSQALLLDALLAQQQNLRVDQTFETYRERLRSFEGLTPKNAPRSFQGTLREYQRDGLGWFTFLDELGVGGCLADDMGLGKTVQILALLEAQRVRRLKKDETRLATLVVVPKSLIFNWMDEAQRFTPQLRVVNYTGVGRKQLAAEMDDAHLILTTYGTLVRDILELKERRFDFAILDEAQAIKNSRSQAAKACLLLQSNRRLALTGTPIENHLGELWSLFEFLNPGMLGRSRAFAAVCKNARSDDGTALRDLSHAIAPFVLRRTKEQVLTELPEKTEQTLYCELEPEERKAYDELRDFYRAKLSSVIDKKGLQQAKIHVLEALLRLRQAACHRGLIDPKKAKSSSAKLDTLLEQLDEIIGEGHKALVFSQFTSLLAIVRDRLDKKSIRYEYLDGSTRNRKEIVDRFQQPDGLSVFLISLKAGGQGLNLTEADYVFILDPWWNPAVEMQAIDRAHRIGQTRPVFAYRIIARDTVEEKVLELQDSKRELANAIITANDSLIRRLTADDLQRILS